ncbi:Spc24 subunit of Ndc80-domain-containing protein [Dipodascopsis tothii]|uniref:Spc24 subunit of Ndc80-domain-containing protein n=1 Tax=Dipodascopsis tothii TaxID=44089 RepID=UPI0034D0184E
MSTQALVSQTVGNFHIKPDVQTIARIDEHLRILDSAREVERDHQHDILRSLARQLDLAKSAGQLNAADAGDAHSRRMDELEREKFGLAKTINDLEAAHHNTEASLARLKDQLAQLEAEDVHAVESGLQQDSTILLIKIYRSLGITFEKDEMGDFTKAIVRSANNDLHVLPLDKTYSSFFTANYLWDMM